MSETLIKELVRIREGNMNPRSWLKYRRGERLWWRIDARKPSEGHEGMTQKVHRIMMVTKGANQ